MAEYQIITYAALLVITHWVMGFICYKFGRKVERKLSFSQQTVITNLKIDNGKLQRELDDAEKRNRLLSEANEQIYDEGKRDQIKETVKEMISEHNQLSFEKIPQKKSIKEGGEEDANNILNRADSSVHILLDDLHVAKGI